MKRRAPPALWPIGLLALLAAAWGGALVWQRSEASDLQREIALLREETHGEAALRAENERLLAARVTPVDLGRLRGDHAALPRLRTEIETLRAQIEAKKR